MSHCIQCSRTPAELGHGAMLLTRARPHGRSEYQICLECAKRVHEEQSERAQEAIRQAEKAGA